MKPTNLLNPSVQNAIIQESVVNGIKSTFPLETPNRRLELVGDLTVKDDLAPYDFPAQREVKLNRGSWQIPVTGSFRLIDKKTGEVLDTVKNIRVANIPKMTERVSMMIDGNEYQTVNQWRLKPGVYTRTKANGDIESRFNLAVGFNFTMNMDPANGIFILSLGNVNLNLYAILHALGVDDVELRKAWGTELFEKNAAAAGKVLDTEIIKLWKKLKNEEVPYLDAIAKVKAYLDNTSMSGEVTKLTLGEAYEKATPEAMIATSKKLLRVLRKEEPEDERDSLVFKSLYSVDDLIDTFFKAKQKSIAKTLGYRAENKDSIRDIISSDTYTKPIREFFTTGDLSNAVPQANPIEMINEWRKTTITGAGGIQSRHAVTLDTRNVHPSHFGFLDPIATPEGGKIGTTLSLAAGVIKDKDGVKTHITLPNGEDAYWTPYKVWTSTVGFPDQHIKGVAKNKIVRAMHAGESIETTADKIDGYIYNPNSMFSYASNTIPFLGHNSANRSLVGVKMSNQSLALEHGEAPLVKSVDQQGNAFDTELAKFINLVNLPEFGTSIVESVTDKYITLKTKKGEIKKLGLYKDFPLNQDSFITHTPLVKPGDVVKPGQKLTRSNFDDEAGDYAYGLNINTAYLPWHGNTLEDAMVITESAAKKFSSLHMKKYTLQTNKDSILSLKKFRSYFPEALTAENIAKLDDNGIIKPGEKVVDGDILVAHLAAADLSDSERILRSMNKVLSNPYRDKSLVYGEAGHEGTVTHVKQVGDTIYIYIKVVAPLEIGDKLSTSAGDKGIVGYIINDDEAPHTLDGERIDLMVNPHGVVGRMNMGQMLGAMAGKIAKKTGKPYLVKNFHDESYLDIIDKDRKKLGIPAEEILLDGKNGKPFDNPVFWGVKHYAKLVHTVAKKQKMRGLPGSYNSDEQPVSPDAKGQSMDPLQTYALLSHGAKQNLFETTAIKGQRNDEYWRALQLGLVPPLPKKNFVFDKMVAYMNAAGINVEKEGDQLTLKPLLNSEMEKQSKGVLTKASLMLIGKNLTEIDGGLFDKKITGGIRGTNWSTIAIPYKIPNPLYEHAIQSVLGLTGPAYEAIIHEEPGTLTIPGAKTGFDEIIGRLKELNPEKEYEKTIGLLVNAPISNVNRLNRRTRYLQNLIKLKVRPEEAFTLSSIPVMPPIYRPVFTLPSGDTQSAPINKHYRDIALMAKNITDLREAGVNEDGLKKERYNLYHTAGALIGTTEPLVKTKEKYEGLLGTLAGPAPKAGFIQNKVWAKPQDISARSTITLDSSLGIDEIGVPTNIAKTIFKPFVIRELVRSGYEPANALKHYHDWTPVADKALDVVMTERPVLFNRAPSLHKHSTQAYFARRTSGEDIRTTPLTLTGAGADYDGDTMSIHVPVSSKAIEEAKTMLPSHNLFKAGDKAHMHEIAQSHLDGIYFITQPGKVTGKSFDSIAEAKKAGLAYTDVFKLGNKNTTIGKELINSYLPKAEQVWDKPFTKKLVSSKLEKIYLNDKDKFGDVITAWKDIGREYSHKYGQTVSFSDMVVDHKYRDTIIDKYKTDLKKKNIPAMFKMMDELREAQDKQLVGKNRFYQSIDSGSMASKKDQAFQVLTMPGLMQDIKGNVIPYPITKSWSEGIDTFDLWNQMYGARAGAVSKSIGTQETGALNKDLLFEAKNLVIVEDDCQTTEYIDVDVNDKGLLDRYLAKDVSGVGKRNDLVTGEVRLKAINKKLASLPLRSPLTCASDHGVCVKCYGLNVEGLPPKIGDNVGITDGQALSERSCNHKHSLLTLQHKNGDIELITLKDLYERYSDLFEEQISDIHPDTTYIELATEDLKVWDGSQFTKLYRIGNHAIAAPMVLVKSKNGAFTVCQNNHPLPVWINNMYCENCGNAISPVKYKKQWTCPACHMRYDRHRMMYATVTSPQYFQKHKHGLETNYTHFANLRRKQTYDFPLNPYWLGFYLAEGCISYRKTRKGAPRVGGIAISQIAAPYMDELQKQHPQYKVYVHKAASSVASNYRINGVDLATRVEMLTGRYSHNKHLPNHFIHWTNEQLGDILAGIIDGDGFISQGQVIISSNSFYMLQQIQIICSFFGTGAYINEDHDNGMMRVQGFKLTIQLNDELLSSLKNSRKVSQHLTELLVSNDRDISTSASTITLLPKFVKYTDLVYDVETESQHCQYGIVVSHNTQLSLKAFHKGGAAGTAEGISQGFPYLRTLLEVPVTVPDKATLATVDGQITNITPSPAGGFNIKVNDVDHYVTADNKVLVKLRDVVKRGDRLSTGNIKPQDLSELKDHLTAQRYVVSEINNIYGNKFHPRTFETVMRALSNNARVLEVPKDFNHDWLRGDVVPYTMAKRVNRERTAEGLEPVKVKPFFQAMDMLPSNSNDWMHRITTNRIKDTMQEGPALGMTSNIHGTDPLSAYLYGLEFGQKGNLY